MKKPPALLQAAFLFPYGLSVPYRCGTDGHFAQYPIMPNGNDCAGYTQKIEQRAGEEIACAGGVLPQTGR